MDTYPLTVLGGLTVLPTDTEPHVVAFVILEQTILFQPHVGVYHQSVCKF